MPFRLAVLLTLLTGTGCTWMRAPSIPMHHEAHGAPSTPRGLVLLLPGVSDSPEVFERHGIIERIHAIDPSLDVVTVDAHLGYYLGEIVVERMHQDIVARHLERGGYDRVWLVGVSIGGLGAMAYAADHPEVVDGLILLAPYMGSSAMVDEIRAAGGVAAWRPLDIAHYANPTSRLSHTAWQWCREVATRPDEMPRLYLGYGEDDRLRPAHDLLSASIPPERQVTMPGGHTWSTWRPLFDALLERALANDASPSVAIADE